jgi:hypothetical protein
MEQDEVCPKGFVQSQGAVVNPFGAGFPAIVTFFYFYGSIPGGWARSLRFTP